MNTKTETAAPADNATSEPAHDQQVEADVGATDDQDIDVQEEAGTESANGEATETPLEGLNADAHEPVDEAEVEAEAATEDGEAGEETDSEDVEMSLEEQLVQARTEIVEYQDHLLRAMAELENTRKRADKQRREAESYGGTRLARDLLSVFDNLSLAVSHVDDEQREAASALIEGIELTLKELIAAFSRNNIRPIVPEVGDKFDPKHHEAMFNAPHPEIPAGNIMTVFKTGFSISERLLRAAQVGVSAGPPPEPETPED